MVQLGAAGTISDDLGRASAAGSQLTTASNGESTGGGTGRRVLDGAFAVLEALAPADGGLGLTALARATGLAKTSVYRLTEQLVSLGAVQRVDHRYYIGARIGHIGRQWQPDPRLRRTGQAPVRTLAIRAGAVASLRILHEDRLRVICATVPRGHACISHPTDAESTARTATGRVLYAAGSLGNDALPDCWTVHQWRTLRESIRDLRATVVDAQEVFPGVCCVSAPVWWADRRCAGAVTAVVQAARPAPGLRELVVSTARCISAELR